MNELRRHKRGHKYDVKKHQSIPALPKKSITLTHNLSTNISVGDFQYVRYSNEVACQKSRNNSNVHIQKPKHGYGVNTENTKISLSQSVQVVPNDHSIGDFSHRNWKDNYIKAEITFKGDYVNLKTSQINYGKSQQSNNTLNNKTSLIYPDVNFHVMSMLLPHLKESLHQNCQSDNVQNKDCTQHEENFGRSSISNNNCHTTGYTYQVECFRDNVNQNTEETSKSSENEEQSKRNIEQKSCTTSKCHIFSRKNINIEDIIEILNEMKQFLDSKKTRKSHLKQSGVFLNEIIEGKCAEIQINNIPSEKLSMPVIKISNEIQLTRLVSEKTLKNGIYSNETVNAKTSNCEVELFLLKKTGSVSTNTLYNIKSSKSIIQCEEMIEEKKEDRKITAASLGLQFIGKYSSSDGKLKPNDNQSSKNEVKLLFETKQLVNSSENISDFKVSVSSQIYSHIFNTQTQELLWKSDGKKKKSKNFDYYRTNIVDYRTNRATQKTFDFDDNTEMNNTNSNNSHSRAILEEKFSLQNEIAPCKNPKDEIVTIFSKSESTESSVSHVPLLKNVISEYSNFNLRGPYCRNYYVYYSKCISYIPVVLNDIKISITHMKDKIRLLKCIQFLKQQYKCLESIAKSILLLIKLLEKLSDTDITFSKCFDGVYAIQKHFNDVVFINKLMNMKMCLQYQVVTNRNISLLGYKMIIDKRCNGRLNQLKLKPKTRSSRKLACYKHK